MGLLKFLLIALVVSSLLVWTGYDKYQAGETIVNERVDPFIKPVFIMFDYLKGLTSFKKPVCEQACILTSNDYETVSVSSDDCREACINSRGYLVTEDSLAQCFEEYEYDTTTARKSRTYVRGELNKMIVQCEAETDLNNTMDEDCLYEVMRAGIEPFSVCQHTIG